MPITINQVSNQVLRRVSSSCSTSGKRRVSLVINHDRANIDGIVNTTDRTNHGHLWQRQQQYAKYKIIIAFCQKMFFFTNSIA